MPINFDYDKKNNVLQLKITGVLTSDDIIDYFNQLIADQFFAKDFIEVVDLNDASDFILRYSDLDIIEQKTKQLNRIGQKATIMYGHTAVAKGISEMMTPLYQKADFTFVICDSKNDLNAFLDTLI